MKGTCCFFGSNRTLYSYKSLLLILTNILAGKAPNDPMTRVVRMLPAGCLRRLHSDINRHRKSWRQQENRPSIDQRTGRDPGDLSLPYGVSTSISLIHESCNLNKVSCPKVARQTMFERLARVKKAEGQFECTVHSTKSGWNSASI